MAFELPLGSIGQALSGMGAGPSGVGGGDFVNPGYNPITISPTALNLGEIMKHFSTGGPATGGYGVSTPSRLGLSSGNAPVLTLNKGDNAGSQLPVVPIAIASAGLLVFMLIVRRRRGV